MGGFTVPADGGAAYEWHRGVWLTKVSSEDTGGDLAVLELVCPGGLEVGEHVHPNEDEVFYVVDGTIDVACGDDAWPARPGDTVFLPRSIAHRFTVTSTEPARLVVILAGEVGLDRHVADAGRRL